MGRPLNDKFFGDPNVKAGQQIMLSLVWIPGAEGVTTDAWIVRQRGVGKYEVTDGVNTGIVRLVDGPTPNAEGEGVLEVAVFGGGTEYARTVNAHQVKTFAGNVYRWSPTGAEKIGDADLPMA